MLLGHCHPHHPILGREYRHAALHVAPLVPIITVATMATATDVTDHTLSVQEEVDRESVLSPMMLMTPMIVGSVVNGRLDAG
jgi:hypothetical protein